MEGKPSIFTFFTLWLARAPTCICTYPHPHMLIHTQFLSHTHVWLCMYAWLCTHIHSDCSKPIIQSESMNKFSLLVAACPVKVRAPVLSKPAVWQIPASSNCICAHALPPLHLASSFMYLVSFLSFIHPSPISSLSPTLSFLPSSLVSLKWSSLCFLYLFFFLALCLYKFVDSYITSPHSHCWYSLFFCHSYFSFWLTWRKNQYRSRFITNDETEEYTNMFEQQIQMELPLILSSLPSPLSSRRYISQHFLVDACVCVILGCSVCVYQTQS